MVFMAWSRYCKQKIPGLKSGYLSLVRGCVAMWEKFTSRRLYIFCTNLGIQTMLFLDFSNVLLIRKSRVYLYASAHLTRSDNAHLLWLG